MTRASIKQRFIDRFNANKAVTTIPNTVEADTAEDWADLFCDILEEMVSTMQITASTNVTIPTVSTIISAAPGAPCTGTLVATATTTLTCTIP